MCCFIAPVIVGMIAGGATRDRTRVRPALRKLIAAGIIASRKIQAAGSAVTQEAQNIVNEARLELDRAEKEQGS